ncbi:MAG: phenylacetate--CoA ligase family protein [Clostridia bacterium]
MFQPAVEAMLRADLTSLQEERWRRLLERLERSPFYRSRVTVTHGMLEDPLTALGDLPFTRKQDLRDNYPWGFLTVDRRQVARVHASSGTGGKPTLVAYTRRDLEVWAEVCARAIQAAGGRSGDVIHNAYGYGLFTGGLGLHQGAEALGATVVPASGGATRRQVTLITDLGPDGLCCTPSFAWALAETMREIGYDPRQTSLRYGIFGAEPWTEAMRERIEQALAIDALDIYGLSEIVGPGVAIECREGRRGLHVAEDHFYPEVVNPHTGESLPPGEMGELVLTTLSKEAMPLVRYRTGDLVMLLDDPCPCGRTHRRISRVVGRVDDMLIVRGVNVFPSEVERVLMSFGQLSAHYQLAWEDGLLDRLRVEVEAVAPLPPGQVGPLERAVTARLRDELGVTVETSVLAPMSVPRPEGKAVRVVDRRTRPS